MLNSEDRSTLRIIADWAALDLSSDDLRAINHALVQREASGMLGGCINGTPIHERVCLELERRAAIKLLAEDDAQVKRGALSQARGKVQDWLKSAERKP